MSGVGGVGSVGRERTGGLGVRLIGSQVMLAGIVRLGRAVSSGDGGYRLQDALLCCYGIGCTCKAYSCASVLRRLQYTVIGLVVVTGRMIARATVEAALTATALQRVEAALAKGQSGKSYMSVPCKLACKLVGRATAAARESSTVMLMDLHALCR